MVILLQSFVISFAFNLSNDLNKHKKEITELISSHKDSVNTLVGELGGDLSENLTTTEQNIDTSLVGHQTTITSAVTEFNSSSQTKLDGINGKLEAFTTKISAVTGFKDLIPNEYNFRILKNTNTNDNVAIYDKSSKHFPFLESHTGGRLWIRIINKQSINEPTVELLINPKHAKGPNENTEFVFGVSETVLKFLNGGKATESLEVVGKIIEHN